MKAFTRCTVCGLAAIMMFLLTGSVTAEEPEGEGNNLSYPVIWAEGVAKTLRGDAGMTPLLEGEFWYWWETDADGNPEVCGPCGSTTKPNAACCTDGSIPDTGWVKAYLQKKEKNVWQAGTLDGSNEPVSVDLIDWGDNLESVDWYTRSQVRTEVVLYKVNQSMLEYEMRHVSGWGIDEVHGLAVDPDNGAVEGLGSQATVYSPCARLTIQKFLNPTAEPQWEPEVGWVDSVTTNSDGTISYNYGTVVNRPIFNGAVHEAEDGPGYYNAEINVKGKIIYGYTWSVRNLNDHTENGGEVAGDYRITFSFDETCGTVTTNTSFIEGETEILEPTEEEEIAALEAESEGTGGGATPLIDYKNNLTYIDVRILDRGEDGGGGGGGNGGQNGPGGSGGGGQKGGKNAR